MRREQGKGRVRTVKVGEGGIDAQQCVTKRDGHVGVEIVANAVEHAMHLTSEDKNDWQLTSVLTLIFRSPGSPAKSASRLRLQVLDRESPSTQRKRKDWATERCSVEER